MVLVVAQKFWEQVFNFCPRMKPIKEKIRANQSHSGLQGHRAPSLSLAPSHAPPRGVAPAPLHAAALASQLARPRPRLAQLRP